MTNVCVIGLGRIGLPLALILAKANHRVVGLDSDSLTINKIRDKNPSKVNAKTEQMLLEQFLGKKFFISENLHSALSESDVVFIAIGTGIGSDSQPEISNLFSLVEEICRNSKNVEGKLFIFKSTVPVGTTRKLATTMEEKTGLRCGKGFFVVFCPERVLGDKAILEMESLPKVIGGMDKTSSAKAVKIYGTVGGKLIIVSTPESAELIKLMDNAYRQTLFAFANDFALLAERFGVNAYEIIQAANDSYPRNNIPLPSAGVGGYCLTKDPLYLESAFREIASRRGFSSVWYWARKANDYMPIHVVELLRHKLMNTGKDLRGSNILVCGITYKENTDDIRNSHGLAIASKLREEGARVYLWDPHVHERNPDLKLVKDPSEILEKMDALVFTIKHGEFVRLNCDDAILHMTQKMHTPIVIDGWGMFQKLAGRKDVYYAGIGITG